MSQLSSLVSQYATPHLTSVSPTAPLAEVHKLFLTHRISSVPVVGAAGEPLGVISRTDLLRIGRVTARRGSGGAVLDLPAREVSKVMTVGVETVGGSSTVGHAARVMIEKRLHRLYVAHEGRLTGVFSTKDLLVAIKDSRQATRVDQHMSTPAFEIPATAPLALGLERLGNAHVSGLVVVDEHERPIGTFTQLDALEARDLPGETPLEIAMSHAMLCLHISTPLFRAAAQASETRARRVLCVDDRKVCGVMTGLDFARAVGD